MKQLAYALMTSVCNEKDATPSSCCSMLSKYRSLTSCNTSTSCSLLSLFFVVCGRINCSASNVDDVGRQQTIDDFGFSLMILFAFPFAAAFNPNTACSTFPSTMAAYAS